MEGDGREVELRIFAFGRWCGSLLSHDCIETLLNDMGGESAGPPAMRVLPFHSITIVIAQLHVHVHNMRFILSTTPASSVGCLQTIYTIISTK